MLTGFTQLFILIFTLFTQSTFSQPRILAEKSFSLADRYGVASVNHVFDDNILLTLAYLSGKVKQGEKFSWNSIRQNGEASFILQPGQTFAFHDSVLPQYTNKIAVTTNAHFNSTEGFESDGWLVGDGVCHLASFMNVAAKSAGLQVVSPTPHDFAKINDVSRIDGVGIYYSPESTETSSLQNLYITNTFSKPVKFTFEHTNNSLEIKVVELAS